MPPLRPLLLAAAICLLAGPAAAQAGQYTLAYDFASDLSGWGGYVEPGYVLCGRGATAGCADVSTNRIMARAGAGQAIWSQGRWEWAAPPGTSIVGGSLAYRTRMRHTQFYARVKMRSDGVSWDAAPALVSEQQTTALTDHVLALASGFRQIGVSLYAHPAAGGLVTDSWDDYVTLVRLNVTVDDSVAPGLAWVDGGTLLDGAWHRGDVCAGIAIADGQSGAGSIWLASDGVTSAWAAPGTGSQYQPGPSSAQAGLCLSAAALGDGVHAGSAGGADASGGQAAPLAFTVRIDRTPPVAKLAAPAAAGADARPAIELEVSDASSGVTSVAAELDGEALPLTLTGGRATGRPSAALAYGAHALTWSVVDAAGNRTDGSSHFDVADTAPPTFGAPQPADGATLGAGDVLAVAVPVSDGGSGVDPDSAALLVDGAAVDHVWRAGEVVHAVVARRLAAGAHRLVLSMADRAGNGARLTWTVNVSAAAGANGGAGPAPAGGAGAGATPAPAGPTARARVAAVHPVHAKVGALRPRTVIVRLRARPRLRIAIRVNCGLKVRTLRVRANKRGIAIVRVVCARAATVRITGPSNRVLVRVAARRLPLRLHVLPQRRVAPTVARVSGRLAELHGRDVVLEALTAAGWHRVGLVRADASGRFATSFAIVHAGQFALRARVPALAGLASLPFVLTMR